MTNGALWLYFIKSLIEKKKKLNLRECIVSQVFRDSDYFFTKFLRHIRTNLTFLSNKFLDLFNFPMGFLLRGETWLIANDLFF